MATSKNHASKTPSQPTATTASKSRRNRPARTASPTPRVREVAGRRFDAAKYAGPGAALLATGALTVAGYVLREQLAQVLTMALKTATTEGSKAVGQTAKVLDTARDGAMDAVEKVTDALSFDSLLRHAGLQRRSTWMSVAGPAVGVMCGFVAGAAVTHFFGRQVLDQIAGATKSPERASIGMADMSDGPSSVATPAPSPTADGVNGGAHRGIS